MENNILDDLKIIHIYKDNYLDILFLNKYKSIHLQMKVKFVPMENCVKLRYHHSVMKQLNIKAFAQLKFPQHHIHHN